MMSPSFDKKKLAHKKTINWLKKKKIYDLKSIQQYYNITYFDVEIIFMIIKNLFNLKYLVIKKKIRWYPF